MQDVGRLVTLAHDSESRTGTLEVWSDHSGIRGEVQGQDQSSSYFPIGRVRAKPFWCYNCLLVVGADSVEERIVRRNGKV